MRWFDARHLAAVAEALSSAGHGSTPPWTRYDRPNNAFAYGHNLAFCPAAADLVSRQTFTGPHRPWQNGEDKRPNRTLRPSGAPAGLARAPKASRPCPLAHAPRHSPPAPGPRKSPRPADCHQPSGRVHPGADGSPEVIHAQPVLGPTQRDGRAPLAGYRLTAPSLSTTVLGLAVGPTTSTSPGGRASHHRTGRPRAWRGLTSTTTLEQPPEDPRTSAGCTSPAHESAQPDHPHTPVR